MLRRRRYGEGDVIAVPLGHSGFALGVVVRVMGKGMLLGYFFGPWRTSVTATSTPFDLRPEDAMYRANVGDTGIRKGRWPVLGKVSNFSRETWPQPLYRREDPINGSWTVARFPEGDLTAPVEQRTATETEVENLPEDGIDGHIFVQQRLNRLLSL